jgi:hypothetical protein
MSITGIDYEKLAGLIYAELHKTFVVSGQWRTCSDKFQRIWEDAVKEALVRAASQERDEKRAASLLLTRLSTATGERATDFYTVAALVFEQLINKYESGTAFFGLGMAWDSRSDKAQEIWTLAIRRALSRAGLSDENPGFESYLLHVFRESADQPFVEASRPTPAQSEQPPASSPPVPKRPWWSFW